MNSADYLLYFVKESELNRKQIDGLNAVAAKDPKARSFKADRAKLTKFLFKRHQPVISRSPRAMDLAKYLQGSLNTKQADDFVSFVSNDDISLSELAYSMSNHTSRNYTEALHKRILALHNDVGSSGVGRIEEVFGENATRSRTSVGLQTTQPGLPANPLPPPDQADDTDRLTGAADQPQAKKTTASRAMIHALIGAGAVIVLAVAPLFSISKTLFVHKRKAEIRLFIANREFTKMEKRYIETEEKLKAAIKELKKRPRKKTVERKYNTVTILHSNFKRAKKRIVELEKKYDRDIAETKKAYENKIEQLNFQFTRYKNEFPKRLYLNLTKQSPNSKVTYEDLINDLSGDDEKKAIAAFFTLEQLNLEGLAIEIASQQTSKLTLNKLARFYGKGRGRSKVQFDLIAGLLHDDPVIRERCLNALKDYKYEMAGYATDLENALLNQIVKTIAQTWQVRFKKTELPYNLPLRK